MALDNFDLFETATRLDSLEAGWQRVRANAGAAGGDRETVDQFASNAATRLTQLQRALREGTYRPNLIRQIELPKPDGETRPLSIPSVIDRVAQTAVSIVLTPILDGEMEESSFGYRPGRSVQQAVQRIDQHRKDGFEWVVDGDIERYFERVSHDRLMQRLVQSVGEGPLTELIALWLEHSSPQGIGLPQGSPISPLLSNLYLDSVDEDIARRGVRLVRFADDFVVLCRSREAAEKTMDRVARLLARFGLELNRDKTRVVSFDQGFRFLGHLFVKSLVLASPNRLAEDDPVDQLLRLVSTQDKREEKLELKTKSEADAGYDRGLRVLYLREPGRRLSVRNQAFTVEEQISTAPVEYSELLAIPHQRIDRVEIAPAAGVTIEAIRHGLSTETPIAFTNGYGETLGSATPPITRHAAKHLAQARHALDASLRLDLARRIVDGRIRNQRALLHRLNRRKRNRDVILNIAALGRSIRKLPVAGDVPELMGLEGSAAAIFWPALGRLLNDNTEFKKRQRQPARDPVNATLNFLTYVLARDVRVLAERHGLHPGFGVLHTARDHHDACVYDLMEEFRAPLVEGLTVYLFNNRNLGPAMFGKTKEGACRIGRDAANAIIRGYEQRLSRPIKSPRSGRHVMWRRLMEEQAVAYAAHVSDDTEYEPYIMDY